MRLVRSRFPTRAPRLGAGLGPVRAETIALQPHDRLLLVTDGLFERRGETITAGLERVRRHALEGRDLRPAVAIDHLVNALAADVASDSTRDDIALLCVDVLER